VRVAVACLLACACGDDDGAWLLDGGGDATASDGAAADATETGWEHVEVTLDDGEILIERVTYRSEGLAIIGQICRPSGAGPWPVVVFNHGGFSGLLGEWGGGTCVDAARNDFVVVESSYRGEDGSEGEIEVCLGEVTDVLVMLDIVLARPYADPGRVLMYGGSHGGCITTRAVQRAAPVHGAVDIFGPSDLAAEHAFWLAEIEAGSPYRSTYEQLLDVVEAATGGTPATQAAAYEARSPLAFAADLEASAVPFLMVHGVVDPLVPPAQSCDLAATLSGVASYHLDGSQVETTAAPAGCEGAGLTWLAGPRPQPAWPGARYLVVYDDVGHDFNGAGGETMIGDAVTFLLAKLPP
jgi:dienelactone hydrolase